MNLVNSARSAVVMGVTFEEWEAHPVVRDWLYTHESFETKVSRSQLVEAIHSMYWNPMI